MPDPAPDLIIGRLASLEGPPAELREWVQDEHGGELFIIPLIATTPINDAIRIIQRWGYDRAAVVTARSPALDEYRLAWLAVKSLAVHNAHDLCHLPTSPSTTLGDLLDMFIPSTSVTLMLGEEELFLRSDESPNVIDDESDVDALRTFVNIS